jgi:peptide/nickel transport system permease protein
MKVAAITIIALIFIASLAPVSYEHQSREIVSAPPSKQYPLGTDDFGRDRLSRLLYGTRISLILAPCAALLTLLIAALVGITAGFIGGWWEIFAMKITDLFLSLPWLFLFITIRALVPLNTSPAVSLVITFLLMGILGWASAARVIRAAVKQFRRAGFVLEARACGCTEARIWIAWIAPHLRSILITQFFISIPVFILGEASLGILGLGVSEPIPSWGNLLRELSTAPPLDQYWIFAPVALLVIVMTSFQLLLPKRETTL